MSKERMMILEMLDNGKITPADAKTLLRALGEDESDLYTAATDEETMFPPQQPVEEDIEPGFFHPEEPLPPIAPVPVPDPRPAPAPHIRRRRYPDPSFAVAMKRAGVDFSPEQLFKLQDEGIEPDQAARLVAVRRQEWTTGDLVEMLVHEVTPELVLSLHDLGLGNLSAHELIELVEHDIQPEYLSRAKSIHLPGLTVQDLIEFGNNDVDLDTVVALQELGPVTSRDVIRAAHHDISASFVRRIGPILPGITVRQMIDLSNHDVSPRYVEDLVSAGFTNLTIRQIINLQDNDIDSGDAVWFREKLGKSITIEDLVTFAQHDVQRDYVEALLDYNLPGLDKNTLIEMVNNDVSVEDVALAREAYGDDITAADLIDMAINR